MPEGLSRELPKLQKPVVWITGASRGIGRELAKEFGSIGCIVILSARTQTELRSLQKEITSRGGSAWSYPCNIMDKRSVYTVFGNIVKKFERLDVLINNAGITTFQSFHETTIKKFGQIFSINLMGAVLAIKAVYPVMMKRKKGWIINILSTAARKTFTDSSAYSAAKSGLQALGNVLREESRQYNIKVTNVYPGPTETEMWSPTARKKYRSRMMSPKSVAEAVLNVYQMPPDVVVEEIVLRPIQGDIS